MYPRCQIAAYFWKPDATAAADSTAVEFSVSAFSGEILPEDLDSLQAVEISHKELAAGVWCIWSIDSTEDINLLLRAVKHGRYYFNGLVIDRSSSELHQQEEGDIFIGKSATAPQGNCGGMYVGPWDQDYHLPNHPSSPEGNPRLVGYNLNAGRSANVVRKHFGGASRHPRALPKLPAWHDSDPASVSLDKLEIQRASEVFRKFDTDHSNSIDRQELTRVAKHVYEILQGKLVTPQHIEALFEKYDTNKDRTLSLVEFQKIFLAIKKQMIREGLLPPYPRHFQWRLNQHDSHVESIKHRVDNPNPEEDPALAGYGYHPTDAGAYQFFNPQFYLQPTDNPYGDGSGLPPTVGGTYPAAPVAPQAFLPPYALSDSSDDDSSDDDYPPYVDPLAHFKVPQMAVGLSHKLMFPELPALADLSALKQDIPPQDYAQVQAGFLRFLKLRLGFSEAIPLPPPPFFPAAAAYPPHPYHHHHHHHQVPTNPYGYPAATMYPPPAPTPMPMPMASAAAPASWDGSNHTYGPNCAWTLQYAPAAADDSSSSSPSPNEAETPAPEASSSSSPAPDSNAAADE
jgi:hypothetical protein